MSTAQDIGSIAKHGPNNNMKKMILLIYFSPAAAVGEDDSLIMSAQHWAVSLH